ncbi:MAG: hypothetical protein R3292_02290 [Alcanivorax sp.]|nr:hypothetical protein [Alcanivorax sp.]
MNPPKTRPSKAAPDTGQPLARGLGCPPATLSEFDSLSRQRQQQLLTMVAQVRQQQLAGLRQALAKALPSLLLRLLPGELRQESR